MGSLLTSWPEPVQRVQLLAESGLQHVPPQYIRPHTERPSLHIVAAAAAPPSAGQDRAAERGPIAARQGSSDPRNIPILDLEDLESGSPERRETFLRELRRACEEWGFLQVKNHRVDEAVMEGLRGAVGGFFKLPIAEKQLYANDPVTYQGYGSRLGTSKGAVLDWGDYFFLNVLPASARDVSKWPTNPPLWRHMMEEYSTQMKRLSKKLLEALSLSLNLQCTKSLEEAFGEIDMGVRINYYPPCPQPELTLGLSPHSDPGGLTLLLQDLKVAGLQILTNGRYKSVEHRVVANNNCERLSIACFINPGNSTLVSPIPELVPKNEVPAYNAMTFRQYRSFIRSRGTNGKAHLDSIASPTSIASQPITSQS
ncbi:hypothetical protein L7F22_016901 [Adiantum nelumboides]|nr:hypothetical protein [Adiantum nelumboides]MCO5563263.1 hypothetical protein [Adiantum nelumboides]MCO5563264.1 hypothetical protein [Adiantum nelumboides]